MKKSSVFKTLVAVGIIAASSVSAEEIQCTVQTLETCPGACVDRCLGDDTFFDNNAASCGRIVRDAQSDPAIRDTTSCGISGATTGSEFGSCLSAARTIQRTNTGRDELEQLFASAPTCAATPFALNEMYTCLSTETDTIGELFKPLVERGYNTPDGQDIKPDSPICTISNTQIDSDELMAESLTAQSRILTSEFETISGCRQTWVQWLDEASDSCKADARCARRIDAVVKAMQSNIEPAADRELEIENIIDDIDEQLSEITGVIFVRTLICPPQSQ